ncbi:CHAD domain-containing protein [Luteimicrobium subarcticum]|uniref:CHAD domain-containing protein n=1 Tax=Luteimicrobium subarcticum TaxID=620910 RepID=UPI0012FDD62D|nr:CHAD domain-containing protein [Luteimicrobium subarcticum]
MSRPANGPADDSAAAPPTTGGDLVARYLREHVDALTDAGPRVRDDEPDAVHAARVASRRLRSTLRTFRPVLDRAAVEPLRAELRWWGGVLGTARDLEVQRDRARALLDDLPAELVVGPVRARLDDRLDRGYRAAQREAAAQLGTERYRRLLADLDALATLAARAARPPLRRRADDPADDVAARVVRHAFRRARRRVDRAAGVLDVLAVLDPADGHAIHSSSATAPRLAAALHEARKKVKAVRYAAEASVPTVGDHAATLAAALADVQDVLGAHHDACELAALFRTTGMQAHLSGENGFTYGLLVERERERARAAVAAAQDVWATASRPRLWRWARR